MTTPDARIEALERELAESRAKLERQREYHEGTRVTEHRYEDRIDEVMRELAAALEENERLRLMLPVVGAMVMPPGAHERLVAELAEVKEREERLQVQLAGCGVAALGGTSPPQVATREMYGWSASYQDVLNLRLKHEETLLELASAERAHVAHHEHENAEVARLTREFSAARALLREAAEAIDENIPMGEGSPLKARWRAWRDASLASQPPSVSGGAGPTPAAAPETAPAPVAPVVPKEKP